jgi:TolB protein
LTWTEQLFIEARLALATARSIFLDLMNLLRAGAFMNRLALRLGALTCVVCCAALGIHAQTARRPYPAIGYGGNYLHNYLIPPAPSATPFAPAPSPNGEQVAFSLHGSLWLVPIDGGVAREIVDGPKYYSSPSWSPDGEWLVYTADDGGKTIELEAIRVNTGEQRQLTSDGAACLEPVFSPDGARIAYTAARPNGFLNVFVRAFRDGAWAGEPIAITDDSTTEGGAERPYFTPQDMHTAPAWISDGELALVSNRGIALGSGAVVRVPVEPLGIRRARVIVDEQTLYHARPAISPDGARVVFASSSGGTRPRHHLKMRSLDDPGAIRDLTTGEFDVLRPRWLANGRSLIALSNRSGLPELVAVDVTNGSLRPIPIAALAWKSPRAKLAVTVRESAGGPAVPARVQILAADGKAYVPSGYYARVSWAGDRVFHGKGAFEIDVPAGKTRVQIVRGFELKPSVVELDAVAGQSRTVDVVMERIDDLSARGWHAGSTGAHVQAGGFERESLESLVSQAQAEGVTMLSAPVADRPHNLIERDFWTGGASSHRVSSSSAQLVLGQEHRPPFFGHIMSFGATGMLDSLAPVTIGYEPPPGASLARTNTDVLRGMRGRGGITSYVHAFSGEGDPMQAGLGIGKAFPVDAALGLVDTLEWAAASRGSFVPWYAALNNGLRVAAIGGEDSITNLHISRLVGCVRTYVYLGDKPLTPASWWEAAKAGRSFVTTGPLVELTVGGERPGGTVSLSVAGRVEVVVRVRSITPLQRVQLVVNGESVQDVPLDPARTTVDWSGSISMPRSGWVHVRAEGLPAERAPLDAVYAQAFTNPVWIHINEQPVRDAAAAKYFLQWIDRLQIMADAWPGWSSAQERAHVFGQFDEARALYRRFAEEAPAPLRPPLSGERR